MLEVVRDKNHSLRDGMRCDQQVHVADGLPRSLKNGPNAGVMSTHAIGPIENGKPFQKRFNELNKLLRSSAFIPLGSDVLSIEFGAPAGEPYQRGVGAFLEMLESYKEAATAERTPAAAP